MSPRRWHRGPVPQFLPLLLPLLLLLTPFSLKPHPSGSMRALAAHSVSIMLKLNACSELSSTPWGHGWVTAAGGDRRGVRSLGGSGVAVSLAGGGDHCRGLRVSAERSQGGDRDGCEGCDTNGGIPNRGSRVGDAGGCHPWGDARWGTLTESGSGSALSSLKAFFTSGRWL